MPAPPESPGRAGPQAPPCARTFRVGVCEERMHADHGPPARAARRRPASVCGRTEARPSWGTRGPLSGARKAFGAGVDAREPPDVKRKLLGFQERQRTESGARRGGGDLGGRRGRGGRRRPLSPPALATAPSLRGPGGGVSRRLRRRAAHGRARGAGSSTGDAGRHLDSRALRDADTITPAGRRRPPAPAAPQRQLRTVLPSETPQRLFRPPSQPRVWPHRRLTDSPSSGAAPFKSP